MRTSDVTEIFSSVQGEGIYAGRRQVFVRFARCNLACGYCDTPGPKIAPPFARVETEPARGVFEEWPDPLSTGDVARAIERLDSPRLHDSITLTGGEPLLCADFITELVPLCGGREFYLETNGTLPDAMRRVAPLIRTVAMDIKLRSAAGQDADLGVAREFLLACPEGVFVKVIVSAETDAGEIDGAAKAVASRSRAVPFVIQPVTEVEGGPEPPTRESLFALQACALERLDDVRIIPQIHKLMGWK